MAVTGHEPVRASRGEGWLRPPSERHKGWEATWGSGATRLTKTYKTEQEAREALEGRRAQWRLRKAALGLVLPRGATRFYVNEEAQHLHNHPSSYPAVVRWDFTFTAPSERWVMLWMVGEEVAAALFESRDRRVEVMGLLALEGQDDHFSIDEDEAVFGDQAFERLLEGPLAPTMWALYHLASGAATAVPDGVPGRGTGASNAAGDINYTLTLHPLQPKRTSKKRGGHRDLREHGVRGHLREIAPGKKVRVRPHKRGNPAKGVITKDYEVAMP